MHFTADTIGDLVGTIQQFYARHGVYVHVVSVPSVWDGGRSCTPLVLEAAGERCEITTRIASLISDRIAAGQVGRNGRPIFPTAEHSCAISPSDWRRAAPSPSRRHEKALVNRNARTTGE